MLPVASNISQLKAKDLQKTAYVGILSQLAYLEVGGGIQAYI